MSELNKHNENLSKMENRRKTIKMSQKESSFSNLKDSRGILNHPPGSLPHQYTF